ncbi:MAG: FG-GAP-like repeat-containing protein, partial [Chlorobium phaeovibrioides]|nr:FG-GAP-like repeat-containing protein [Chlorobium phaeovibrioides]
MSSLYQIAPPDLAALAVGGATLQYIEPVDFSDDGRIMLVRTTFTDDGAGANSLHYGMWLYDVATEGYLYSLNALLAGSSGHGYDIDVEYAALSGSFGDELIIAQHVLRGIADVDTVMSAVKAGTLSVGDVLASVLGESISMSVERFVMSEDGRFLAVQTDSPVLAPEHAPDANDTSDIYLVDLSTKAVERVSLAGGSETSAPVYLGDITSNGAVVQVAFVTDAAFVSPSIDANTSSVDAGGSRDAYVWSSGFNASGLTGSPLVSLVSLAYEGYASGFVVDDGSIGQTGAVHLTSAGTFFTSTAANLVTSDANGSRDVFYKPASGLVERVVLAEISELDQGAAFIGASSDGRYVAMLSDSDEVAQSSNIGQMIVVDRTDHTWHVVSGDDGSIANDIVIDGIISPDGGNVAFTSAATNLDDFPVNSSYGLFAAVANRVPTGAVTISGIVKQNETVTAVTSALADADGLGTFSYQWKADGTAISNATASTYTLTQDEVGTVITVEIGYTDGYGTEESVMSSPTAVVEDGIPVIERADSFDRVGFAPRTDYATQSFPLSVSAVDLDGDGAKDIVSANAGSDTITVLLNQGDGTFAAGLEYVTAAYPKALLYEDLNGDGALDLVVTCGMSGAVGYISVFINNGDGEFTSGVDYNSGFISNGWTSYAGKLVGIDIDDDGDVDLVGNNGLVLLNDGVGAFIKFHEDVGVRFSSSPESADLNGDGHADLIGLDTDDNFLSILFNNGEGVFDSGANYPVSDVPSSVADGDVDGDGDIDIVVANWNSNTVSVFMNNGAGTFAMQVDYAVGGRPSSVTITDINGDGAEDIVSTDSYDDTISVLLNQGDGTFSTKAVYATGNNPSSIDGADLNGDGLNELVVANADSYNGSVSVFPNTAFTTIYTEQQQPLPASEGIKISHPDGEAAWRGGSITIQITAGADFHDVLGLPLSGQDDGGIWFDSEVLMLKSGDTAIGSGTAASATCGAMLTFTFNDAITGDLVQMVARSVLFSNDSDDPGSNQRTVTYTLTDSDGYTASFDQPVGVTPVNDPPTFSGFSDAVSETKEDTEVLITLDDLLAKALADDVDGSIVGFEVIKLKSGSLYIGLTRDVASRYSYTNDTIDATHSAWWRPSLNASGTVCAFNLDKVIDDEGAIGESGIYTAYVGVIAVNDPPSGTVTVSGQLIQGEMLSTVTGTLSDPDGLGTLRYQWYAGDDAISGATASTYTLTQDEVGKVITVEVSYTDDEGTDESVTSSATAAVANINDAPTGSVTISGTAAEDQVLTAVTTTLADEDGLGTLSYQWYAGDDAISNATASTYTLTQAEVGKAIKVKVSYTDDEGTAESVTSAATAAVANINDAPTGSVTISGTAAEDQVLTAVT